MRLCSYYDYPISLQIACCRVHECKTGARVQMRTVEKQSSAESPLQNECLTRILDSGASLVVRGGVYTQQLPEVWDSARSLRGHITLGDRQAREYTPTHTEVVAPYSAFATAVDVRYKHKNN
jgi:hypothetical protein